ncbi:hypothetical protein K443DRAFT_15908, partial [Laccaria amethystina LaAM-08-1]
MKADEDAAAHAATSIMKKTELALAVSGLSVAPPAHPHPSQAVKPNEPQSSTHDDSTTDSQHTTTDETNPDTCSNMNDSTKSAHSGTSSSDDNESNNSDNDDPAESNDDHDGHAHMSVDKAPTTTKTKHASKGKKRDNDDSKDGGDDGHDNSRDRADNSNNSSRDGADNDNDHNSDAPMRVDEAPTKRKTQETSKGKKHNNNNAGDASMHIDAAQGDNQEPLANDNDANANAPMRVDEAPTKRASKGKKRTTDTTIQPTSTLVDPTSTVTAVADTTSNTHNPTTTITTDIPMPITAVETRGGAAGSTHPVSPNTAGPRAGDMIMKSPPPLSQIQLEGASRTHGGIFKIHLYVSDSSNPADWAPQLLSRQVLKHPVTTSLKVVLQYISERHSPVQKHNYRIYTFEEPNDWFPHGRYEVALRDEEDLTWLLIENEYILHLLMVTANSSSMPSSHFPSVASSRFPSVALSAASGSMPASVSASAHPSTVPDTPDEGAEVLYDKDILNNPLWYNAALLLGVDPSLTYRKKDTGLRMHYQKYKAYQSAWDKIQHLTKQHQWPYPQFLKTELINLFGRRGMWNSHTVKGMQDISQFPKMQEWLEREDNELEPTDEDVWG